MNYAAAQPTRLAHVTASACGNNVRCFSLDGGNLLRTLVGHRGSVTCLHYSPDLRILMSGGDVLTSDASAFCLLVLKRTFLSTSTELLDTYMVLCHHLLAVASETPVSFLFMNV